MTLDSAPPRSFARLVVGALLTVSATAAACDDWPQWGGPERNFRIDGQLAATWPPEGPRIVWRRLVGDGYSAVAAAGSAVYTLYRAREDVAFALDATTGEQIWSHRYPAPIPRYMRDERGLGPRSTPLVTADHVFVIGVRGTLQALDRASGSPVWRRELVSELGGSVDKQGYAASPLAWRDLLIVPVGGEGRALVALHQADGEVVWRGKDFESALTSPFLIDVAGEPQVVALLSGAIAGFAPGTGAVLWHHPHPSSRGDRNISTTYASYQLLSGERAWTAPTVAGRRVYVRTRSRVLALELPGAHRPQ